MLTSTSAAASPLFMAPTITAPSAEVAAIVSASAAATAAASAAEQPSATTVPLADGTACTSPAAPLVMQPASPPREAQSLSRLPTELLSVIVELLNVSHVLPCHSLVGTA
jgi:hypothetical protein